METWKEEWTNDVCGCSMHVTCRWVAIEDRYQRLTYAPGIVRVELQRSLFCSSAHEEVHGVHRAGPAPAEGLPEPTQGLLGWTVEVPVDDEIERES